MVGLQDEEKLSKCHPNPFPVSLIHKGRESTKIKTDSQNASNDSHKTPLAPEFHSSFIFPKMHFMGIPGGKGIRFKPIFKSAGMMCKSKGKNQGGEGNTYRKGFAQQTEQGAHRRRGMGITEAGPLFPQGGAFRQMLMGEILPSLSSCKAKIHTLLRAVCVGSPLLMTMILLQFSSMATHLTPKSET